MCVLFADKDKDTITCIWKQSGQSNTKMQVPSGLFWSTPDSNAFICANIYISFLLAVACGCSWSSCSPWSCSWGSRLSWLSSCLLSLVLGVPDCHCGLVHGIQGCHCHLVHGFPACHRCLPACCCPVLYIIRAYVVLLFDSFILVTSRSCLGSNDGEFSTFLALLYLLCVLFIGVAWSCNADKLVKNETYTAQLVRSRTRQIPKKNGCERRTITHE